MAIKIARVFSEVGNMNGLPRSGDARQGNVRAGLDHHPAPQWACVSLRERTVERSIAEAISLAEPHGAVTGLTKPHCVRQRSVKHWLQLSGRTANDLQYIASCALL